MSETHSKNRVLDTEYDEKGRERARAILETPGKTDEMYISPNQAIPVIFIPGIMGSPLIATGDNKGLWEKQGKWAWFPDSGAGWVARGYGNLSPQERKRLLNPTQCKPVETPKEADEETLKSNCNGSMPWQEAARRGWGSVMLSSYSEVLHYLEDRLRHIFYRGSIHPLTQFATMPESSKAWGEVKGFEALSEEDLRKAAAWRFPVYAVGYNWMDSNAVAAEYLKKRIDDIRKDCRERLKLKCDKVILVTHSMGGLVARYCAKHYPEDILGVVHGEQPAIGAGTAYARVRCGWESNKHASQPLDSVISMVGAMALGHTGEEVATVFASGAGPLELLPNQLYGNGWLKVKAKNAKESTSSLFSLPENGDPYGEIYADSSHWWRLIHPGFLVSPEQRKDAVATTDGWKKYEKQLKKAKEFHYELGSYYHPKTYAHCGDDGNQRAWHQVTWRLEPLRDMATGLWASNAPPADPIRKAELTSDRMRGTCEIRNAQTAGNVMYSRNGQGVSGYISGDYYRAWLSEQDSSGDATVPGHSGLAPRPHVPFFARMRGFEHQGSYAQYEVKAVTLYSIVSLAREARSLA